MTAALASSDSGPDAPRVAYQGEPGAYGELAIEQEWGGFATAVGARTFAETLDLVGRGDADYAVIPVWNTTIGEIPETRLLLEHHTPRIETVSELTVPIQHCLLALPGATLATVRLVGSHVAAIEQCRRLFATRPGLQPCIADDTAGAARQLAALGGKRGTPQPHHNGSTTWFERYRPIDSRALAVIAAASVAELYGLIVLAEDIQDEPGNATRFVVVKMKDGVRW